MMIFSIIMSLLIGSFLGVIIDRLPQGKNWIYDRSRCNHCQNELRWHDLIPVLSFIKLKGRCHQCKETIAQRHLLIELVTAILFAIIVLQYNSIEMVVYQMILSSLLMCITFIDIDTYIIYDRFHIFILALCFIQPNRSSHHLPYYLLGSLMISLPLLILAILTQGIGGGDVKLMASSGFLLGPDSILCAFILSTLLGGLYAVWALLSKHKTSQSMIPFAPFLCFGIFIASLYTDVLWHHYITWIL